MPNAKMVVPPSSKRIAEGDARVKRERVETLGKKKNRTPAETAELIDLLAARVIALETAAGA